MTKQEVRELARRAQAAGGRKAGKPGDLLRALAEATCSSSRRIAPSRELARRRGARASRRARKPAKWSRRRGEVLARHAGVHNFTIGPAPRLGIRRRPAALRRADRCRVAPRDGRRRRGTAARDLRSARRQLDCLGEAQRRRSRPTVKIRYRHEPAAAVDRAGWRESARACAFASRSAPSRRAKPRYFIRATACWAAAGSLTQSVVN